MLGEQDGKEITICASNIPDSSNLEGASDPCSAIWETMRHELIHLFEECMGQELGGGKGCRACLCSEMLAYGHSGQCVPGSYWYSINDFQSSAECIYKSAAGSCFNACLVEDPASTAQHMHLNMECMPFEALPPWGTEDVPEAPMP
jgi:hypothetical protein